MKAILFLFLLFAGSAHAEPLTEEATPTEEATEEKATEEKADKPSTEEADKPSTEEADKPSTEEADTKEPTEANGSDAPDEDAPATDAEAIQTTNALIEAINNKNWTLVFGFGVMLLVYIFRKSGLMKKVPTNAIVWVGVGIGTLIAIAAALIGGAELQPAIVQGVIIGLSGAGLWTAVGKHGLPSLETPDAPIESPEDKT